MNIEQATQWIPFDKERMSEAVGYRVNDGFNDLVTEVAVIGDSIAFLIDGKFGHCTIASRTLEMLVPVVVKYPCLCWAANTSSTQYVAAVLIYSEDETSEMYKYKAGNGNSYKHATPLTTAELAEIGLKQIS